jgi:hypothetical protein
LATDLGVGNITVICNGMTQIITGYYPSTPSCGASSSANFNMLLAPTIIRQVQEIQLGTVPYPLPRVDVQNYSLLEAVVLGQQTMY